MINGTKSGLPFHLSYVHLFADQFKKVLLIPSFWTKLKFDFQWLLLLIMNKAC